MINRPIGTVYDALLRDAIHRYLPNKYRIAAGVWVKDRALLDLTTDDPDYKAGLIDAIHECVDDGDRVELVGLGRGVSTINCLRAGADTVVAYEASAEMIDVARETLRTNYYDGGTVDIRHALVGDSVCVYGAFDDAEMVPPADLGVCDVLIMDCEGAEESIVAGLDRWPRHTIIETHPERGVPTEAILEEIPAEMDVYVFEYEPENPKDKKVIVAANPRRVRTPSIQRRYRSGRLALATASDSGAG